VVTAEDRCEAFAKYGIYDTRDSLSDEQRADSFRAWLCQSNFSDSGQAENVSAELGYKKILDIGYDKDKKSWSKFQSEYCSDASYQNEYRKQTSDYVKTINITASNNMLACFNISGLHARIIPGYDSRKFILQMQYNSDGKPSESIDSIAMTNSECKLNKFVPGAIITPADFSDICTRTNTESVEVVINATRKIIWDTPQFLPAIPTLPPTPKYPELLVQCPKGSRVFNDFTQLKQNEVKAESDVLQFNVNAVKINDAVDNIGMNKEVECKISIAPTSEYKIIDARATIDPTNIDPPPSKADIAGIVNINPSVAPDGSSATIKVNALNSKPIGTVNLSFRVNYLKK